MNLGIIILSSFSAVLLTRPFWYRTFVCAAAEQDRSKRVFILDFSLCLAAGLLINSYDRFTYNIPLFRLVSMMIGSIIAGFFLGLDSSLAQERANILHATSKDAISALPKGLIPMTRKFTFVAVSASFLVAVVIILVFNRDIEWLSQTAQDAQFIPTAQLSVISEVFFIMAILLVLIINLIFSYSRNMTLLFDNQTKVLEQVRNGDLSTKVPVATHDEFGIIAEHTNDMIDGLRHRFQLINSLKMAEEVQQNLLPDHSPSITNFDISGISIYCDETGGDYYDYFSLPEGKFGVVVADACGHDIGAALLMTSVRAFLTSSIPHYSGPARLLGDINSHISRDCAKSGRFITMFFLEIDSRRKELKWVRAGHEPALLFNAESGTFSQLAGSGLVLGVDGAFVFEENSHPPLQKGDIILVGTDGINETRNRQEQTFGHDRLQKVISDNAQQSALAIQQAIVREVKAFREAQAQEDDITLVTLKVI